MAFSVISMVTASSPVHGAEAQPSCAPPVVAAFGDDSSAFTQLSDDGRFAVFQTFEDNAAFGDTNGLSDVYMYDRLACALERVSPDPPPGGTSGSYEPSITSDGRFVAFNSTDGLLPGDTNGLPDLYVWDRTLDSLTFYSLAGVAGNGVISGDGSTVVVYTGSGLCFSNGFYRCYDIWAKDLASTTAEQVAPSGAFGARASWQTSVSHDGRYVAYQEWIVGFAPQIFVYDRVTGTRTLVSAGLAGGSGNAGSGAPSISADGRYVAFASDSSNLVVGDTNGAYDVFVRDVLLGTTERVSVVNHGGEAFGHVGGTDTAISGDGRYVAFVHGSDNLVAGDTNGIYDVFVHDRQTAITRRASTTADGIQVDASHVGVGETVWTWQVGISDDGAVVTFLAWGTLFAEDAIEQSRVVLSEWKKLSAPPLVNLVMNGDFSDGFDKWRKWSTPDPTYMVSQVTAGGFEFYRVPPPPGTSNQAVAFQELGVSLKAGAPIVAQFDLGNSSSARRRVSVLLVDAGFADLHVCTFWLPPNSLPATYQMLSHTTVAWTNVAIYFYAATAGSNGGFYRLDDVSVQSVPGGSAVGTTCIDPTAPSPPGGPEGPELLANGDFSNGLASWGLFGSIIVDQINDGVFEFYRPPETPNPAGVILQPTTTASAAGEIVTAQFQLGNSSAVRKRVTILLHDVDFSDLAACTFWLAPGQPLSAYGMRTFATKAWTNTTISVYAATVGTERWTRLDNVSVRKTPGAVASGTDCGEPGSALAALTGADAAASLRPTMVVRPSDSAAGPTLERNISPAAWEDGVVWELTGGWASAGVSSDGWEVTASAPGPHVLTPLAPMEVDNVDVRLAFWSWLSSQGSTAEVQVSVNGITWVTLAEMPATDDWTWVEWDLSAYAGRLIWVRFVFDDHSTTVAPAGLWLIEAIRLVGNDTR